jgi:hypothetical protein
MCKRMCSKDGVGGHGWELHEWTYLGYIVLSQYDLGDKSLEYKKKV